MTEFALVPSARTVRRLDRTTIVIVAGFAALGLLVGLQLWNLAQLHRGLLDAASALDSTAAAIGLVADAPFIGANARQIADDVTAAATDVRGNAALARDGVRTVAVGIGSTIALLALFPALVLYLPLRLARRRELRALARLVAAPADPMLVEHLARAAVRRVPYAELRRTSRHPWQDLERGRHRELAAAELRRLGLPAPDWSDPATDPGLPRTRPGVRHG